MIKINSRVVCWKVKNIEKDFEILEDQHPKELLDEIIKVIDEIKAMHPYIDIDATNIEINLDTCEVFYLADEEGKLGDYRHVLKTCKPKIIVHDHKK